MSTKKTTVNNSTSTAAPPSWAAPGLNAIGEAVTNAVGQLPGASYTGPFIAQANDYDRQVAGAYAASSEMAARLAAQMEAAVGASQQGPVFGGPATAVPGNFADYDVSALQPVIAAATAPILRQLTEQVLPGLQSDAIASGAYGGSRALETLPAMAMQDFSTAANEVGMGIAHKDFLEYERRLLEAFGLNTERGLGEANVMTDRLGLLPELTSGAMKLSTGVGDLLAGAGAYDRSLEQMAIDDALAEWQYQSTAPFAGLDVASNILATIGNPWGTQTGSSKTTEKTGGLGAIAQGVMGAGMLGASLMGGGMPLAGMFGSAMKGAAPVVTPGALDALGQRSMASIWG